MKNKHVLITGAAGFIGTNLVEYFLNNTNYQIVCLDRKKNQHAHMLSSHHNRIKLITHDMAKPIGRELVNDIGNIEYVIHLAGATDAKESTVNPSKYVLDNINGTLNLLEFTRHYLKKVKKIIYFNTAEVYGPSPRDTIFSEDQIYNTNNPYAASKIGAQEMCLVYHRLYDLPIILTYTANVFGPAQKSNKFIPLLMNKIFLEQEVDIHVDVLGMPIKRNYLHVNDICQATHFLMKNGEIGQKYNIAAEKNTNNLKIAQLIAHSMNRELKYRLIHTKDDFLALPMISAKKLRISGWKQQNTLENGLKELIKCKMKQ